MELGLRMERRAGLGSGSGPGISHGLRFRGQEQPQILPARRRGGGREVAPVRTVAALHGTLCRYRPEQRQENNRRKYHGIYAGGMARQPAGAYPGRVQVEQPHQYRYPHGLRTPCRLRSETRTCLWMQTPQACGICASGCRRGSRGEGPARPGRLCP